MVMSWIWAGMLLLSVLFAAVTGNGAALSSAAVTGAQNGITLAVAIAGPICLWSGVGKLMEELGLTQRLAKLLSPVLNRLFPSCRTDSALRGALSGNICANLLGLGNAATPMGIRAAQHLAKTSPDRSATDELCRLIVLNTASIQLIPANIAAVRAANGCATPFDILPAVWLTSTASVIAGLCAAWLLGRVWKRD